MTEKKYVIKALNESAGTQSDCYISPIEEKSLVKGINENEGSLKKINKLSHSWTREGNNFFVNRKPNSETLPSGFYGIRNSQFDGLFLEMKGVILDDLFYLPDPKLEEVVVDFQKFWSSKEKYREYGITYKRGILMHGPQGTGKSSLINLLINKVITEFNGIVLEADNLDMFIPMAHNIRCLEPDKPILAVIEEIDSFLQYNSTKNLLNLLDGNLQIDNVIYLATTNYLERIEPRIKNRPSRFDLLVEIGFPNEETREFYIKNKLKEADLNELGEDGLAKWIRDTKDMSFAHLKELIVSCIVLGNDYDKTIVRLKEMNELK